jgi:predicted transcriptional regulator
MLSIGLLEEANQVITENSELGKVHETFLQLIVNTKKMRGTSPIFHPDFVRAFKVLLNQGGTIELILTEEVLSKTLQHAVSTGDGELFQKFIKEGQLKIYIINDLKVALTVTEQIFSMGLFNLKGQYDYATDLVSLYPDTLQWGEELFLEYRKKAKKLEI